MNFKINGKSKIIKVFLLGTVLGGIIFGGLGVAAVTLTAKDIKYTPSNEEFTATNAKEALDEIYELAESVAQIKSSIKYIDVSIPENANDFYYYASQISDTAEIIGAGMISREHNGWQGLHLEYTTTHVYTHSVTYEAGCPFIGNWVMRVWYID